MSTLINTPTRICATLAGGVRATLLPSWRFFNTTKTHKNTARYVQLYILLSPAMVRIQHENLADCPSSCPLSYSGWFIIIFSSSRGYLACCFGSARRQFSTIKFFGCASVRSVRYRLRLCICCIDWWERQCPRTMGRVGDSAICRS